MKWLSRFHFYYLDSLVETYITWKHFSIALSAFFLTLLAVLDFSPQFWQLCINMTGKYNDSRLADWLNTNSMTDVLIIPVSHT